MDSYLERVRKCDELYLPATSMNIYFRFVVALCAVTSSLAESLPNIKVEASCKEDQITIVVTNKELQPFDLSLWKEVPRGCVLEFWTDEIGGRLCHAALKEIPDGFFISPKTTIEPGKSEVFKLKLKELVPTAAVKKDIYLVRELFELGLMRGCEMRLLIPIGPQRYLTSELFNLPGK